MGAPCSQGGAGPIGAIEAESVLGGPPSEGAIFAAEGQELSAVVLLASATLFVLGETSRQEREREGGACGVCLRLETRSLGVDAIINILWVRTQSAVRSSKAQFGCSLASSLRASKTHTETRFTGSSQCEVAERAEKRERARSGGL